MAYRPSASLAAPSGTPTRMTFAPASGCFLGSVTMPLSFPVVPARAAEANPHTASVARAATLAILSATREALMKACRILRPTPPRRPLPRQEHPPGQRGLPAAVLPHPQAVRVEPAGQ